MSRWRMMVAGISLAGAVVACGSAAAAATGMASPARAETRTGVD
jgi:hypothetical protein